MMYLSKVTGLSKICYPDSTFLKSIKFDKLRDDRFIFHNAWNLNDKRLELFSNIERPNIDPPEREDYKRIDARTLCACSALPFIEETVTIDGKTYCEGALVDTVNFRNLLEDHPDLDEIWVSRIVDSDQIRKPNNLHDSLANLCQLFAATVGEDDVKLFEYHVKEEKKWTGTIIEIRVNSQINFEWSHANLDVGRMHGRRAATTAYQEYVKRIRKKKDGKLLIIRPPPEPSL
jgi:predicted acylesterase/phospholipase RssA